MNPGDVVVGLLPGAQTTKIRPAVVLSSSEYHLTRPDVIVGVLTTKLGQRCATDHDLVDWEAAGLHDPSMFRLFLITLPRRGVHVIGSLSSRDWEAVRKCIELGIAR